MRTTFIGLFVIVGLCAAMLYAVTSYFGREADMRAAEIAFHEKYGPPQASSNRPAGAANAANDPAASAQAGPPIDLDEWYGEAEGSEPSTDLNSWYAAAGSNEGPADTQPTDNSYLVNDTEPFVSTDPL